MLRQAWIELMAWFEGGVTASRLAARLDVSVPTAQRLVAEYQAESPGHLVYDAARRRHFLKRPPKLVSEKVADYLDLLRGASLVENCAPLLLGSDAPLPVHLTEQFLPPRSTGPAQLICQAIREERVVRTRYRSPHGLRLYLVSPHRLVHADGRYHVRGYLHDGTDHVVDLVLGRFAAVEFADSEGWVGPEHDHEWQSRVRILVRLNPDLPEEACLAVMMDWMIDENGLEQVVPQPLAVYVRRSLERHRTSGLPTFIIEER